MEVVIADGYSTDATRVRIEEFRASHPELALQVVDNPRRNIPAGLNVALAAARGDIIVRLDAHSMPYPDYVERCVAALEDGKGDNVGGVWEIRAGGTDWMAQSIAGVAAHPLGVGDALYRYTRRAGLVDTVPFGAFRRELIRRIGPFDENLLTNEDYEFNVRVRQGGGRIWLDPAIRSVYFARPNLKTLAAQYWRYGFWKARMLRRYPHTLRWRQFIPPFFVVTLLILSALSLWLNLARWIFLAEIGVYCAALFVSGTQIALQRQKLACLWGAPLAMATIHFSWGMGLLWSLFKQ
jgi:succinoglycan biosynthesis protein ExoA